MEIMVLELDFRFAAIKVIFMLIMAPIRTSIPAQTNTIQSPHPAHFEKAALPDTRAGDATTPGMTAPPTSSRLETFLGKPLSDEQKAHLETMEWLAKAIERKEPVERYAISFVTTQPPRIDII